MEKFFLILMFILGINLSVSQADNIENIDHMEKKNIINKKNRLSKQKSPYLLQHADNPVDWQPWDEQALNEAQEKNKPIFLSIGYSTCHWCHVMEHESFENPDIAAVINEYFLPIKVDREERPDIDSIYMSAVTSMTGQGGWPLTVFLTPDRKPFYGGTYFPPFAKWGSPGLMDILQSIHNSWITNRQKIVESSQALTDILKEYALKEDARGELSENILDSAFHQFEQMYDPQYGGFGRSPKFPTSHNLSFLLRYGLRSKNKKSEQMVDKTLQAMAYGGMYDHLGGGFHRYSTDARWHIPHFEKMLYDQALLATTYLEAYQKTANSLYARIAKEIFDYVLRDLTDKDGGFYSAEDADSYVPEEFQKLSDGSKESLHKKEGAYYLWRQEEIDDLLGEKDSQVFNFYFGVEINGNAQEDPHGEFIEKNILYINNAVEKTAQQFNITDDEVRSVIEKAKAVLLKTREQRPRPHLDDKVLLDWNGLMIGAMAKGARILGEDQYQEAAIKAADFLLNKLCLPDGKLLHRYRDGETAIAGNLDDYAFFIYGLIELYQTTFDEKYLNKALELQQVMVQIFWDKARGGFFFTAQGSEDVLFRQKEIYDGAVPAGNSIAALNLIVLYHLTLDEKWQDLAAQIFQAFAQEIKKNPSSYAQMLSAFDFFVGPSQEIVIAEVVKDQNVSNFLKVINEFFLPNKVLLMHPAQGNEMIEKISPFIKSQTATESKTTVYLCENHVCKLPIIDEEILRNTLEKLYKVRNEK
ncbi:MAG: thioredoxin domain-containing protein [Candidatus Omnitrophica bacterium]|nr:thioredoxin domain-containing protein [Candidatus Omnitrophota bacterium]